MSRTASCFMLHVTLVMSCFALRMMSRILSRLLTVLYTHNVMYLIKVVNGRELHARNESIRTNEFVFQ